MASLYQRSGRDTWYGQFYDSEREPKQKQVSLRTANKRQARRILARLEQAWELGDYDPWTDSAWSYDSEDLNREPLSLSEARDRFLDEKERQDRSQETIRTYREILRRFIESVGDQLVSDLDVDELEDWIRDPSLARATRRKRYQHVRTWANWLESGDYIGQAWTDEIKTPPKAGKLPKAIREEELEQLCEAIREDYRSKLGDGSGGVQEGQLVWRIPAIWMGFLAGLRASELGRLRWEDVDLERRELIVRQNKSGEEQKVPLSGRAVEVLKRIPHREGYVFRSPTGDASSRNVKEWTRRLSRAFRKARDQASLREELSLHSTRHGYCTRLAEAGKSAATIQALARHADVSTSMQYVHLAQDTLREELDEAFGAS